MSYEWIGKPYTTCNAAVRSRLTWQTDCMVGAGWSASFGMSTTKNETYGWNALTMESDCYLALAHVARQPLWLLE